MWKVQNWPRFFDSCLWCAATSLPCYNPNFSLLSSENKVLDRPSPEKQAGKNRWIINNSGRNCWILLKFGTWVHYPDYSRRMTGRTAASSGNASLIAPFHIHILTIRITVQHSVNIRRELSKANCYVTSIGTIYKVRYNCMSARLLREGFVDKNKC